MAEPARTPVSHRHALRRLRPLRRRRRPCAVAELIRLLHAVGVDAPSVRSCCLAAEAARAAARRPARRTAAARLRPCRRTPASCSTTATGASTAVRPHRRADGWVLAVFSVPEAGARQKRACCSRSRLARPRLRHGRPRGVDRPGRLYEETRHTLRAPAHSTRTSTSSAATTWASRATVEAVARWWDLDAVAQPPPRTFLEPPRAACSGTGSRPREPRRAPRPQDAYRDYLLALDSWRHLPYADPLACPPRLLPEGWPGDPRGGRVPGAARAAAGARGPPSPGL
ncbi:PaaX family transcriptional regulator OS=Streptomyces microflavus OX=1919 GN=G3I39_27915 PE=4 SV=1 [Streptomyces microflavus]